MAIRRQGKKSSSTKGGARAAGKGRQAGRPGAGRKKSALKQGAGKSTASRSPSRRKLATTKKRNTDPGERLQKILAAAGFGSRRACEELILEGRVEVDRQPVTALGAKADPATQEIRVDGEVLRKQKPVYYAAYKPKGVISTSADPSGRPRVTDLVPDRVRVFTVGRLDRESEGLVLLTNDGELANLLTHPRHGVEKYYQVQVAGHADWENVKQLLKGVYLAEGHAKVKRLKILKQHKQSTLLEMVLDEGRNREIRRVLARLGHKVQHLKRVAIGTLRLAQMAPGEYRPLTRQEIRALKDLVSGKPVNNESAEPGGNTQKDPRGGKTAPKSAARSGTKRPTGRAGKPTGKPTAKKSGKKSGGPARPAGRKKPVGKKSAPRSTTRKRNS